MKKEKKNPEPQNLLENENTSADKKELTAKEALQKILRDLSPIRFWIYIGVALSLISVLLSLLGPYLLGSLTNLIYNAWLGRTAVDTKNFLLIALALTAAYAASAVFHAVHMKLMNNVISRRFTCDIRIRISEKIKKLMVSYIDNTQSGEIISRMTDDVSVLGVTVHTVMDTLIGGIIKILAIAVIIFIVNPILACIIIVFIPASVFLSAKVAQKSEKYFTASRKKNGEISAFVEENCTGFDTVKAFGLAENRNAKHAALSDEYKAKSSKGAYLSSLVQPVIAFLDNVAYIAICLLGGYFAVKGSMDVGSIVAFILYAKNFAMPLESIAYGFGALQNTLASAKRVYGILDETEMEEGETKVLQNVKGDVTFENVHFSYKADTPLIQNFNAKIQAGMKVAIVGPTGAGKTTLVNLLMRFYEPDAGVIKIDGTDISAVKREDVRNQFAMVLQDTWLFSGTVYENIAYGSHGAGIDDVKAAAKNARADRFIESLEKGYDTPINEESSNLSGGQKQLLTIARAYLSGRKMLILDEATSSVDTRTEIQIQESMDELMRGKTSFVIAHRLSTIVDADLIFVIDDGQIVEQGTHRDLIAAGGFYSEIYYSQYHHG